MVRLRATPYTSSEIKSLERLYELYVGKGTNKVTVEPTWKMIGKLLATIKKGTIEVGDKIPTLE